MGPDENELVQSQTIKDATVKQYERIESLKREVIWRSLFTEQEQDDFSKNNYERFQETEEQENYEKIVASINFPKDISGFFDKEGKVNEIIKTRLIETSGKMMSRVFGEDMDFINTNNIAEYVDLMNTEIVSLTSDIRLTQGMGSRDSGIGESLSDSTETLNILDPEVEMISPTETKLHSARMNISQKLESPQATEILKDINAIYNRFVAYNMNRALQGNNEPSTLLQSLMSPITLGVKEFMYLDNQQAQEFIDGIYKNKDKIIENCNRDDRLKLERDLTKVYSSIKGYSVSKVLDLEADPVVLNALNNALVKANNQKIAKSGYANNVIQTTIEELQGHKHYTDQELTNVTTRLSEGIVKSDRFMSKLTTAERDNIKKASVAISNKFIESFQKPERFQDLANDTIKAHLVNYSGLDDIGERLVLAKKLDSIKDLWAVNVSTTGDCQKYLTSTINGPLQNTKTAKEVFSKIINDLLNIASPSQWIKTTRQNYNLPEVQQTIKKLPEVTIEQSIKLLETRGHSVDNKTREKLTKTLKPVLIKLTPDYLKLHGPQLIEELSRDLYNEKTFLSNFRKKFKISTENLDKISMRVTVKHTILNDQFIKNRVRDTKHIAPAELLADRLSSFLTASVTKEKTAEQRTIIRGMVPIQVIQVPSSLATTGEGKQPAMPRLDVTKNTKHTINGEMSQDFNVFQQKDEMLQNITVLANKLQKINTNELMKLRDINPITFDNIVLQENIAPFVDYQKLVQESIDIKRTVNGQEKKLTFSKSEREKISKVLNNVLHQMDPVYLEKNRDAVIDNISRHLSNNSRLSFFSSNVHIPNNRLKKMCTEIVRIHNDYKDLSLTIDARLDLSHPDGLGERKAQLQGLVNNFCQDHKITESIKIEDKFFLEKLWKISKKNPKSFDKRVMGLHGNKITPLQSMVKKIEIPQDVKKNLGKIKNNASHNKHSPISQKIQQNMVIKGDSRAI